MIDTILAGSAITIALYISEPNALGRSAAHTASLATYKASGLDIMLNDSLKKIEQKYINEQVRSVLVGASFFYRMTIEQKVEFTWSF